MHQNEQREQSFEQLMDELKKTLEVLEKGELSLEESLKAYENGVKIVRAAETKLAAMEGKIEQIMADGTVSPLTHSDEQRTLDV